MEFPFNVNAVLRDRITILRGGKRKELIPSIEQKYGEELARIVNEMGVASSKAQGLRTHITSYNKLQQSPDQILYILKDTSLNYSQGAVVGIIKTGRKRLFLTDTSGLLHEVEPLCILDFYVHESQQRQGHGKNLFEQVLQQESVQPFEVAIDRPSPKFLHFLQKHYHLQNYVKQNNNFVVFDKFFSTCVHVDHGRRLPRRHSLPNPLSSVATTEWKRKKRVSLSPLRNELPSIPSGIGPSISPKLRQQASPISSDSLSPHTSKSTLSPIGQTSSTSLDQTSRARVSLSPWNTAKFNKLPPPTIDEETRAPYLTMRTRRHKGQRWLNHGRWGCGFQPATDMVPHDSHWKTPCYSRHNDISNQSGTTVHHDSSHPPSIPSYSIGGSTHQGCQPNWKSFLH